MRDRMRRRNQPAADAKSGEPALPPLQPSFADAPPEAPGETPAETGRRQSARTPSEPESPPAPAGADKEPEVAEGQQGRRRRRRGRGGRGRARPRPAATATPLQPVYPEFAGAPAPGVPDEVVEAEPAQTAPAHPRKHPPHGRARPAAPAAASPRPAPAGPSKGTVVLAIGLPGSGKSTWFKRRGVAPLSSDLVRSMLFDNVAEQSFQDLVFSTLRSLLRARLVARMPMNYVDATNLSAHDRCGWIKMAHDFGYEVQGVFFDVPLEVCMERNSRRNRIVPEEAMRRMAGKLRPPSFDEGFAKITVVRVKPQAEGGPGESAV
jgi:predicted kinase